VNGDRTAKGRFGPGNQAASRIAKAKSADGYDGVVAYSGWIASGESNPELQGSRQWRTYARMYERPPVAIWARLRQALFSGITWTAVENEKGGKAARRGKEIVEQGLLKNNQLALPWSSIAAEAMNGAAALGHSIHATAMGRRSDGLVVYTDIAQRPQSTIEQWFRAVMGNEATPFVAVLQRVSNGDTARLELDECLYVVNNNGTGSTDPRGVGMLRLIAERVRRLDVFEKIEGTEVTSSMGGIPIVRAPLQEMKATLRSKLGKDPDAVSKIAAAIDEKTRSLSEFVINRFKDASKLAWHLLDSATFEGSDPNTITPIKKWDIEIIKGDLQGLPDIRTINKDHDLDIARMLGIEHVFMGGGDTKGTYDALEQKIETMGSTMNAEVGLFAYLAARQAVRRLVRANGLDPDEAAPTLQPSPIFRTDILRAVQAITALNLAGLAPNHPAKKSVFQGVDLPWEDESQALMAPRRAMPPLPAGGDPAAEKPTTEATDPGEKPTEAVKRRKR
jgi:hypothetical protein